MSELGYSRRFKRKVMAMLEMNELGGAFPLSQPQV
jgi:hypothetical protein